MNARLVVAIVFLVFFGEQCGTSLQLPPAESVRVKLTDKYIELLGEDSMAAFELTDTTIHDSPATPVYRVAVQPPAGREAHYFDTATVHALVTKRGNAKRAWIETCPNEYYKNNILRPVVQWKFQPNLRCGVFTDTLGLLAVPLTYKR